MTSALFHRAVCGWLPSKTIYSEKETARKNPGLKHSSLSLSSQPPRLATSQLVVPLVGVVEVVVMVGAAAAVGGVVVVAVVAVVVVGVVGVVGVVMRIGTGVCAAAAVVFDEGVVQVASKGKS